MISPPGNHPNILVVIFGTCLKPRRFFFLGTALAGKDGIRMVVHCDNHGHDGGNRMLLIRPWKPYMKQGYAITSKEELKLEMYRMALGLWADMLKCLRSMPTILFVNILVHQPS